VDLVDLVDLWILWILWICGSCGSCGSVDLVDLVDLVELSDLSLPVNPSDFIDACGFPAGNCLRCMRVQRGEQRSVPSSKYMPVALW
jgi:hypothetical protein